MAKLSNAAAQLGSLGGKARARKLSRARRREIARQGGKAKALKKCPTCHGDDSLNCPTCNGRGARK